MSYILEALKKSKEERQKDESPHLHIVHGTPAYRPPSMLSLKRGVVCACLAVLLAVGAFFLFKEPQVSTEIQTKVGQSIKLQQIEIRSQFFEQQEDSVAVDEPSMGVVVEPAAPQVTSELSDIIVIAKSKEKKRIHNSAVPDVPQRGDNYQEIPYRKELPQDVQKSLPQFVFAGHTYADDPGRRMIIINNSILREGDTIDADTTLINIIWEGVVLEYKGMVFKQRIH